MHIVRIARKRPDSEGEAGLGAWVLGAGLTPAALSVPASPHGPCALMFLPVPWRPFDTALVWEGRAQASTGSGGAHSLGRLSPSSTAGHLAHLQTPRSPDLPPHLLTLQEDPAPTASGASRILRPPPSPSMSSIMYTGAPGKSLSRRA